MTIKPDITGSYRLLKSKTHNWAIIKRMASWLPSDGKSELVKYLNISSISAFYLSLNDSIGCFNNIRRNWRFLIS